MKRKTKIIVAVMGAVSLAGITVAALALLYVWSIFGLPGWRVRHADYPAVLRGCREMMLHRNSYSGRREDASREGEVFLEFAGPGMDPKLPKAIRALHPQFAIIRSNNVFLAVTGGFSHLAFEAYADGAKPDGGEYPGHKKLIDDLWLIYDQNPLNGVRRPMLKALARIFGNQRKERVQESHDPVLGALRLAEEDWQEATVAVGGRNLGFKIGGGHEPDPALLEHARDIVRGFPEFDQMVRDFLVSEARRMPKAAGEIRQLVIENVMLCWPKRPHDGMLYFSGPDQYRVWRCDYVGRKPKGLGFDD